MAGNAGFVQGRVRAIGVSNFQPDRLMDLIIHNEIVPAVNQVETHPFQQQIDTQKFLQENKVQIESWGPFAEGKNNIFHNELLESIAAKYNKSVAQVILRWLTQRGVVAIPKSVRKQRIEENFDVFDFELSAEELEVIRSLDTWVSSFFEHRDPAMVKWLGGKKIGCLDSPFGYGPVAERQDSIKLMGQLLNGLYFELEHQTPFKIPGERRSPLLP